MVKFKTTIQAWQPVASLQTGTATRAEGKTTAPASVSNSGCSYQYSLANDILVQESSYPQATSGPSAAEDAKYAQESSEQDKAYALRRLKEEETKLANAKKNILIVTEVLEMLTNVQARIDKLDNELLPIRPSVQSLVDKNKAIQALASEYSTVFAQIDQAAKTLAASSTAKAFAQGAHPVLEVAVSKPHLKDRFTVDSGLLITTVKAIEEST